jgi:hypothetical protein
LIIFSFSNNASTFSIGVIFWRFGWQSHCISYSFKGRLTGCTASSMIQSVPKLRQRCLVVFLR